MYLINFFSINIFIINCTYVSRKLSENKQNLLLIKLDSSKYNKYSNYVLTTCTYVRNFQWILSPEVNYFAWFLVEPIDVHLKCVDFD